MTIKIRKLPAPEGYFSEEEMSKLLQHPISTMRAYHSCRSNLMPPKTKIGNMIIYNRNSFYAWLAKKEEKPIEIHGKKRNRA